MLTAAHGQARWGRGRSGGLRRGLVRRREGKVLGQRSRTRISDKDKKREEDAEKKSKTEQNARIRKRGAREDLFFHERLLVCGLTAVRGIAKCDWTWRVALKRDLLAQPLSASETPGNVILLVLPAGAGRCRGDFFRGKVRRRLRRSNSPARLPHKRNKTRFVGVPSRLLFLRAMETLEPDSRFRKVGVVRAPVPRRLRTAWISDVHL